MKKNCIRFTIVTGFTLGRHRSVESQIPLSPWWGTRWYASPGKGRVRSTTQPDGGFRTRAVLPRLSGAWLLFRFPGGCGWGNLQGRAGGW